MHFSDYTNLVNLIPPAVGLAVLAYFSRFFGKIIADQKAFSDNRDWDIELGGVLFMILLVQGVVGAAAAIYGPHLLSYQYMHIVDLSIVIVAYGVLALANTALSAVFFKLEAGFFRAELRYRNVTAQIFFNIGKHVPLSLVPIVLFYIATIEYLSGSIIWIILIWSSILYILIQLAFNFSLRKMENQVPVAVYFVDESRKPLENVLIHKVNNDNIRLRHDDSIVIVNKNQVLKIVMAIPDKDLDRKEDQKKVAG
jgi:hypothetical protein